MSTFVAFDVETANVSLASICQIGLVRYEDGTEVDRWDQLVDPQDFFDEVNTSVHGLHASDVAGAPTFKDIFAPLAARLRGEVVVSHTPFDRISIERAASRYRLPCPECTWLDSAQVARRAWADRFARAGYGLANVCEHLKIEYDAHHAVSDAWAAGQVLLHAIEEAGVPIKDWISRVEAPITPAFAAEHYSANPDGVLFGEVVCFTGALRIPRRDAAACAAAAGCEVVDGVTKRTTLLVVGEQDARKLVGHDLSSKHRKAEQLIAKGAAIRILGDEDFRRIATV